MNLQTFHQRTAKWAGDTWEVSNNPSYYWENDKVRSPIFTVFSDALNWIIEYDRRKAMTTWTTEDREALEKGLEFYKKLNNGSPPHIVDSGASPKTLGEYIEQENREEMLRHQLEIVTETMRKLQEENMKLKRQVENLMDGRC